MVVLASDTSIVFRRGCGRGHLTITLKKTAAIYFFWGNKAMFCGREKIFPRSRCDFFASSANHIVKADLTHGRLTPKISTTIFSLSQPWIYQRLRIDLSRSSATTKSSFTKRVILIPRPKTTSRIWSRKSLCSFGRRFLWKAFPRSNPAYVLRRNWEVWARGRNSSTRSINEKFKRKIQTKSRITTDVVMRLLCYSFFGCRHALVRLSFSSQVGGCCYAPKKEQRVILENGCGLSGMMQKSGTATRDDETVCPREGTQAPSAFAAPTIHLMHRAKKASRRVWVMKRKHTKM